MSVKRYDPELEKDGGLGVPSLTMYAKHTGSWVEYKDYAALEETLAQRDAQIAALEENLNSCLITVAKYSGPDAAPPAPVKLPEIWFVPMKEGTDNFYRVDDVVEALKAAGVEVADE